MRKSLFIAQEAYDDVGYHELADFSHDYKEETELLFNAIEHAHSNIHTLQKLQTLNAKSQTISKEQYQITLIALEDIQQQVGFKTTLLSTEDIESRNALALESAIGDMILKIIEAIKKAFAYIWQKIKDFFTWLFSSAKKSKDESIVVEAKETFEKVRKTGIKVKESDLPVFTNEVVLDNLNFGDNLVVNYDSVKTLISNYENYIDTIRDVTKAIMESYGSGFYLQTVAFGDVCKYHYQLAVGQETELREQRTFLQERQEVTNLVSGDFLEKIRTSTYPINISLVQNFYKSHDEKVQKVSKSQYSAAGTDIQFTNLLKEIRTSKVIGRISRLFFVLYEGDQETFEVVPFSASHLNKKSISASKYLELEDITSVVNLFERAKKEKESTILKFESDFKFLKATYDDSLKELTEIQLKGYASKYDPKTREEYEQTFNIFFRSIKTFQQLIYRLLLRGVYISEPTMQGILEYIKEHEQYYKKTLLTQG
jgi:hypothetical protein